MKTKKKFYKYEIVSDVRLKSICGGQQKMMLRGIERPWFTILKHRHK